MSKREADFNIFAFRQNIAPETCKKKLLGALLHLTKSMNEIPSDKRTGEAWELMAETEYALRIKIEKRSIHKENQQAA
ncbi:MAG TPA: hypothetical protein VF817_01390 [Patescibacteria group bacterium]